MIIRFRRQILARVLLAILVGPLLAMTGCGAETRRPSAKKSNSRLGINLSGPTDWNSELPFVDVFRMSRPWISQQKGKSWGKGPPLELDENGWVKRLAPGCAAETLLCSIPDGHYPAGNYSVRYDGFGEITFRGSVKVVRQTKGRIVLRVDPKHGAFFLKIVQTNPKNYIRNIRVIMQGFEQTYKTNPFHPAFLKRWQGVASFRFMDWMETNNSKIQSWSQRPKLSHATYSKRGIPIELMVDLCNRLQSDAWFCMPHLADDDYVRQFAKLVKKRLDPDRKIYIEYSNEVWNGMFQQARFARKKGVELGLASEKQSYPAGGRYYARRSVEIFKIWEDVLGNRKRLRRVLAGQAANPYYADKIMLPFEDAYQHADVFAIAPYLGLVVRRKGKKLLAEDVTQWPLEKVLDYVESQSLPKSIQAIKAGKALADKYGLQLVAYEGGQHLVGIGGAENNAALTKLLLAANRHPRLGEIYEKYFAAWTQQGGDLFCYFSSVSRPSKWGNWGMLSFYDEDLTKSPKFMATMKWAQSRGQKVNLPD